MPMYTAPGVYIQEVSTGARPIQPVGTSTAGFVGVAPNAARHPNQPVAVESWEQFVRAFIDPEPAPPPRPAPPAAAERPPREPEPAPGAGPGPRREGASPGGAPPPAAPPPTREPPAPPQPTDLARAVHGFFLNGGRRCYVVNVGPTGALTGAPGRPAGLDLLEPLDEIAIVAAPGYHDKADHEALLSHCEKETLQDRVAVLDPPPTFRDADALLAARPRTSDRGFGAFYAPWPLVVDAFDPRNRTGVPAPPSGHVAGVWARTDSLRGVHKAPANETLRGTLGLTYNITRAEQEKLNPAGVNCLRTFSTAGTRIWGARTVADPGSEWTYLNVRRLFNMVEESIARSTRWVVFEPNDEPLWKDIRRDLNAFLRVLWRDGALQGATPEEAFFVKCDRDTNPQEEIDLGRVTTVIGIAPVKPAEFIVFKIGQHAAGTDREPQPA
jgi:phage tail sheath protein FI